MTMNDDFDRKDHGIIKLIINAPDLSQAKVADRLKFAVGTVNRRLKKLEKQGYLTANPLSRKKNRYLVTDKGYESLKKFDAEFSHQAFLAFRQIRSQFLALLPDWRRMDQSVSQALTIYGEGDAVEICRLVALEQGLNPAIRSGSMDDRTFPHVEVDGL